jgi:hypothetical protein
MVETRLPRGTGTRYVTLNPSQHQAKKTACYSRKRVVKLGKQMRRSIEILLIPALLISIAGCSGLSDVKHPSGGGGGGGGNNLPSSVTVSPATQTLQPFSTQTFTATVSGASSSAVTWQVNGVAGGSQTTGLISSGGVYSAPYKIAPSLIPANGSATVTVTAISQTNATLSGSATVTLETQEQVAQNGAVKLGTSGGNINDTATGACCSGTLGSLVSLSGTQFILSNNHVLARSDSGIAGSGGTGDPISQPGLIETNCNVAGTQTVAHLSQFFNLESGPTPKVDAALAQIVSGLVDSGGNILLLGATQTNGVPDSGAPAQGAGITPAQAMAAPHNGLVAKSGRTTGLTCSTVLGMNMTSSVDYYRHCGDTTVAFTVNYTDLVSVSGGDFSASGDSGSLIVTQDTAEAVALLFAGSDTDSVGNPVGDVLTAFAGNSGTPTFVGGSTHPVLGCSLTLTPAVAKAPKAQVAADVIRSASLVRDLHAPELLANVAVDAVGIGQSYDHPGQAAILLFVNSRGSLAGLPRSIDGVSTRVIQGESWPLRGLLTSQESAALLANVAEPLVVYTLRAGELERAKTAQKAHQAEYLSQPEVLGVGISSSVDAPGEAALLIYVKHGASLGAIPAVIDGLRTRVRETSRFVAGRDSSSTSQGCRVPTSRANVAQFKP